VRIYQIKLKKQAYSQLNCKLIVFVIECVNVKISANADLPACF